MSERTGRCLCGSVTFTLSEDPVATRICWCTDCQHLASNGTVNLLLSADDLSVEGELAEYVKKADSGNELTRQFCPKCGTQLFVKNAARPTVRIVRAGTLDDPSSIRPDMNIWTKSAPVWACLDTSLENVESQPLPPGTQK